MHTPTRRTELDSPFCSRTKIFELAAAYIVCLAAAGCGGSNDGTAPPPTSRHVTRIAITTSTDTIAAGDSIVARATAYAADGSELTPPPLEWTSSDTTIARVDSAGTIKTVGFGPFTVTVSTSSDTLAIVSGTKALYSKRMITNVVLSRATGSDTVTIDDTLRITATARDGFGTAFPAATVVWSVSDTSAASIDAHGLLHAKAMAPVTVTATVTGPADSVRSPVTGTTALTVRVAFTHIAAGTFHTCGIARGGSVYCWGEGAWGRLGDGTAYPAWTAIAHPVRVLSTKSYTRISLDEQQDSRSGHTCGVATDGSLVCWGSGAWGMLGDGADGQDTDATPPHSSAVPIIVGSGAFVDVAAGAENTCALKADGSVYCAGSNSVKQLGVDTLPTICMEGSAYRESCSNTYVKVSGGMTFSRIFAAGYTTCGLTSSGDPFCWGMNLSEMGDLSLPFTHSSPTALSSGVKFASMAGGALHMCGLTPGGIAYCWGDGAYGALGTGLATQVAQPTRVVTPLTFTRISAGGMHTCATTASGEAYCWGMNTHGELGAPASESCANSSLCSTEPVHVQNVPKLIDIAAGFRHSCGLSANGAVYCWGAGDNGQLGNGSTTNSATPVRVKDTM